MLPRRRGQTPGSDRGSPEVGAPLSVPLPDQAVRAFMFRCTSAAALRAGLLGSCRLSRMDQKPTVFPPKAATSREKVVTRLAGAAGAGSVSTRQTSNDPHPPVGRRAEGHRNADPRLARLRAASGRVRVAGHRRAALSRLLGSPASLGPGPPGAPAGRTDCHSSRTSRSPCPGRRWRTKGAPRIRGKVARGPRGTRAGPRRSASPVLGAPWTRDAGKRLGR